MGFLKNNRIMRKTLIITSLIFLLGVAFSSCITSKKINYLQKPDLIIPSYNDTISFQEYQLRVGDYLYIRVHTLDSDINIIFDDGAMTGTSISGGASSVSDLYTYIIKPDGTILFPLIENIFVKGKSTREVKEMLEQELSAFISSCTVEVRVVRRYFSVIGAGVSGRYSMPKEKVNIFEALAMAGDISLYGDRSKVRIMRETESGTEIKIFDIRSADIFYSEFYYVEPNDVIYIQTMNEQFFSMSNFPAVLSTTISTFSFGLLIYNYFLKPKE